MAMSKGEAGRLGGRSTFARHGREHMAEIGRRGFQALATFKNGGRRGALARLASKGKLVAFHDRPDHEHDAAAAELYAAFDLD
jgi:general stress protein YciG